MAPPAGPADVLRGGEAALITGWAVAHQRPGPRWLPAAALALLAWTYLFGNAFEPSGINVDDASLLDVSWRIVELGEVRYPAFLSDAFGSDRLRRFPPLSGFWLRTGFHALVGVSGVAGRTFSALAVLAGLLIGAAGLGRLVGAGPPARAAFLLLAGLATPVIGAARTIRNEQEVFLLGMVGCLLLPMLHRPDRSRRAAIGLWAASGLAVGVAAASHPFGVCYPLVLGGSLLLGRGAWAGRDGLSTPGRLAPVAAGLLVGAAPSAIGLLIGGEQARAYLAWQLEVYSVRELEMVPWMAQQTPFAWARGLIGAGAVARLNALDLSAWSQHLLHIPGVGEWFSGPTRVCFYLALLAVGARALLALRRRERFSDPLLPVCLGLALAFPALFALYPANTAYGLYASVHVHLGLCLVLWGEPPGRWPARAIAALHLLTCALVVVYALVWDARLVRSELSGRRETISLDQELAALADAGARAGFLELPRDSGGVYTSVEAWIAGGRAQRSILEPVVWRLSDVPTDHAGAVFTLQNMDIFTILFGGGVGVGAPIGERTRRLSALLEPLALREVILAEVGVQRHSLLVYARAPAPGLEVSLLRRDGSHGLLRATEVRATPVDAADGAGVELPAGRYLLLARLEALPGQAWAFGDGGDLITSFAPTLSLAVGADPPREVWGFRLINSVVPMPVTFEVPAPARVSWGTTGKDRLVDQRLFRLEGW